jgi:hypothetical protein
LLQRQFEAVSGGSDGVDCLELFGGVAIGKICVGIFDGSVWLLLGLWLVDGDALFDL